MSSQATIEATAGLDHQRRAGTVVAARTSEAAVDLYWIPLGAGGHSVRFNGRVYEALSSLIQRRPRCDIYHSALQIAAGGARYTVEMTPVPNGRLSERGVVGVGPVGTRWAGRLRIFRYEIRCWRDGMIPDIGYAVGGPVRITDDAAQRGRFSTCCRRFPHSRGVVMRRTRARCGVATPSSHGCSPEPASIPARCSCRRVAAHPDGTRASQSRRRFRGRALDTSPAADDRYGDPGDSLMSEDTPWPCGRRESKGEPDEGVVRVPDDEVVAG